MINMTDILKARQEFKDKHGAPPKEVRMNPFIACELEATIPESNPGAVIVGKGLFGPDVVGMDWYADESVSEQEGFRLI